jgi:hypothetical protein
VQAFPLGRDGLARQAHFRAASETAPRKRGGETLETGLRRSRPLQAAPFGYSFVIRISGLVISP